MSKKTLEEARALFAEPKPDPTPDEVESDENEREYERVIAEAGTLSPEALDRLERVELAKLERREAALDDRQTAREFWTPDKETIVERNPYDKTLTVKCASGLTVKLKPLTLRDEEFIDNFQRKRSNNPHDLLPVLLDRKCEILSFGRYSAPMDWKDLLVADGEAIAKALKDG